MVEEGRDFTREELSLYEGRRGAPAFFAFRGLVYDATDSFLWHGGKHQVTHLAGRDHTDSLREAPHGEDLLSRLPVVGRLIDG